jgi:hypothetical protein
MISPGSESAMARAAVSEVATWTPGWARAASRVMTTGWRPSARA